MPDPTSLPFGLAAGFLAGALLAWLWAAAAAAELRKQADEARTDLVRLRDELAAAQQARVAAETRGEETLKSLQEQKALLSQARQEMAEAFKALSSEALKTNNESFLNLAKTTFATLHAEAKGDLAQRQQAIDGLIKPLQDALRRYEEQIHLIERSRREAYGGLDQHLKSLAESHQRLQQETGNLVKALRAPTVRGRWGEITLKRVAELAGMVAHCDFIEQASVATDEGRLRPDMIVQLPNGRQIVVDAKAVLSAYLEAHEAQDEAQRIERLKRHAAQVRSRIEELGAKAYWAQFPQAPEFVVLFLPGEHFLGAALDQDPTLIEDGFAQGVVLATPTTLIALLRAVAYGWRQQQLNEHAQQAGRMGEELFERVSVLVKHMEDVGQALDRGVQAYNKVLGSYTSRILPTARRLKELGVASDKELPQLEPLEQAPKPAPSGEPTGKDRA
ncbi:MAG: DNA recombination protein RmuC [Nitrospirota bacterium]